MRFEPGKEDVLVIDVPDAEKHLRAGENSLRIEMSGKSTFPYTLAWSYRTVKPASAEGCPVKLSTRLDRNAAGESDTVRLTVNLENVSGKGQGMAVAIVGLPAGLTDPIAQYDHTDAAGQPAARTAVIGGFTYRGHQLRQLRGQYVFGDYSGSGGGHLFVLGRNNQVQNLAVAGRDPLGLAVLGFARDDRDELYLLASSTGTLLGKTGVVMKLVRARR